MWAIESIKANGYTSELYFSSRDIQDQNKIVKLPYEPETYDSPEKIISSIEKEELFISDFLFISALKLSFQIATLLNKKLQVFFLGFDFLASPTKVMEDYSNHLPEYTNMVLKVQESIFRTIKDHYKGSQMLELVHVGNRSFSDISVLGFNSAGLSISSSDELKHNSDLYNDILKKIKRNIPIVVAELTNNHIGDKNRLKAMIRLAKEAGADAVKVQKRDVESFYTKQELNSPYNSPFGETLGDYRNAVELTEELFDVLSEECSRNELFWFTSILDLKSYHFIQKYKLPLIKLPSTISNHRNFISKINSLYHGDIVISTGFTNVEYENYILKKFAHDRRLFLLQCTSSYPAPPEACNISVVRHYNDLRKGTYPNLFPGYSSHDVGSTASMMAVAAGALIIEKHVKLGNLDWVHFDGVALDLVNNEFKRFVDNIKIASTINGFEEKAVLAIEDHKYIPNKSNN